MIAMDYFRQWAGWHPWRFWGLGHTTLLPNTTKCNGLLPEHSWQDSDTISRDDIRDAITIAMSKIAGQTGFNVIPQYDTVTKPYARPYAQDNTKIAPLGSDGRWAALSIDSGYIQALGIEELTLIQANVPITYSDLGSDGINDLWKTGAVVTTVTDPLEIAAYISSTYRINGALLTERWRIEPIRAEITAGSVIISGPMWNMARPVLYEDVNLPSNGIDISVAGNFMTTIDIYRRRPTGNGTTIDTSQGVLIWESNPGCCGLGWCSCGSGSIATDPAAIATAIARVGIRDSVNGIVIPGEAAYDVSTGTWSGTCWGACRQPDRVTVRFYAGYPLVTDTNARNFGHPDPFWLETTCILAAAELTRPPNTCDDFATRKIHQYQVDLARTGGAGNEEYGAISQSALSNPLGTRRGQVEAWRRITDRFLPGATQI